MEWPMLCCVTRFPPYTLQSKCQIVIQHSIIWKMSSLCAALTYTVIMKQLKIHEKQRFTVTEHRATLWPRLGPWECCNVRKITIIKNFKHWIHVKVWENFIYHTVTAVHSHIRFKFCCYFSQQFAGCHTSRNRLRNLTLGNGNWQNLQVK